MKNERQNILTFGSFDRVLQDLERRLNDLDWLARIVWGEARGEPTEGKIAVAWVVRNRVRRGAKNEVLGRFWGATYPEVIQKPFQFSALNEGDPNRDKVLAVNLSHRRRAVRESLIVAAGVLSDTFRDPTGGADHYLTKAVYYSPTRRPSWSPESTIDPRFGPEIGNHVFFQLYFDSGTMIPGLKG